MHKQLIQNDTPLRRLRSYSLCSYNNNTQHTEQSKQKMFKSRGNNHSETEKMKRGKEEVWSFVSKERKPFSSLSRHSAAFHHQFLGDCGSAAASLKTQERSQFDELKNFVSFTRRTFQNPRKNSKICRILAFSLHPHLHAIVNWISLMYQDGSDKNHFSESRRNSLLLWFSYFFSLKLNFPLSLPEPFSTSAAGVESQKLSKYVFWGESEEADGKNEIAKWNKLILPLSP